MLFVWLKKEYLWVDLSNCYNDVKKIWIDNIESFWFERKKEIGYDREISDEIC